jgi:tRNA(Arg) A34 adenosine deaminase TadA
VTRKRAFWWLAVRAWLGSFRFKLPFALDLHKPWATETDLAMMRRALALAEQAAAMGEVPVGAVVYRTATGEVLSQAHNRREVDADPAAHAEFLAMRDAARVLGDWRLEGCTVVVTLEPCPMCAGMIINARPDRVVYGAADPKAGAVRSIFRLADDVRLNHRASIVPGVLEAECAAVLKAFFKSLRAKHKAQAGTAQDRRHA